MVTLMNLSRLRKNHRRLILAAVILVPCAAVAADEPFIRHVPVTSAEAGAPLTVEVRSRHPEAMLHLRVLYRVIGRQAYEELELSRLPNGAFVADIPGSDVRSPGIEYYLAADAGPLRGLRFASPDAPHRVRVGEPSLDQRRDDLLAAYDGRRSRFSAAGTYVSYGPVGTERPPEAGRRAVEQYYTIEADFTYRFLSTLHSLRFGAVRLRGDSITGGEPLETPVPVGYDFGFTEVWLNMGDAWGLAFELQLGANQERFTFGAGGSLRIGGDPGTHFVIWGGGTVLVGAKAGVRLHWDTVPRVPMAASIEMTTWPDDRRGGLRLMYEAEVPLGDGISLVPEIAYQARSARFGRVGGGLRVAYAF